MSPQQQQDIPRVIEIGKKWGLEILPRRECKPIRATLELAHE
jgi:hypothetical protein